MRFQPDTIDNSFGSNRKTGLAPQGASSADGANTWNRRVTSAVTIPLEAALLDAKVLIVDDQPANLRLLERVIRSAGWTNVEATTDSATVVTLVQATRPDALLLDLMMPVMDGFAVMQALEACRPADEFFPILALTADANPMTRAKALDLGATDFLNKPFDNIEVVLRLRNLLRTRLLHQRVRAQAENLDQQVKERTRQIEDQALVIARAPQAITIEDGDHLIQQWNAGAAKLYGWTDQEAVGRNAIDLLYSRRDAKLLEAMETTAKVGSWTGELTQRTKDGREVIVDSSWNAIAGEDGKPRLVFVISSDITEKKKIQAQFLRAQRMESLGTLAGGIAHDMNNLLSPIMLGVPLLRQKLCDPADLAIIDSLQASAERGSDMVRQILSFARVGESRRVRAPLKRLVGELTTMLKHAFPKDIAIETSIDDDLWAVSGDPTQLHQVLMNLCVNARDAMAGGGELLISAQNVRLDERTIRPHLRATPGPYVTVAVKDTGSGIASKDLDRVFDPFFTTKSPGKGTGLGLSTSLGIIESHGGFFDVASQPGGGATFRFFLPAVDAPLAPETTGESPPAREGHGELILVADDEAPVREVVASTLRRFGYEALCAVDGADALAKLLQRKSDVRLVLMDIMMPVMDGSTAIGAIRKLYPDLPIIATSGLKDERDPGIADAKVTLLPKPYAAEALLGRIAALLHPVHPTA